MDILKQELVVLLQVHLSTAPAKAAREGRWGTAALDVALIPFGGAMTAKGIQLASKGWKGKKTFLRSGNVKKWAKNKGGHCR